MEHTEHILIVDDDSEIRELLHDYLTNNGFPNVSTAIDGETAKAILDQEDTSLLILDIMLPGEDGFSIAKSIRRNNSIPILMLSARTETRDRIHGLEIGADDYLIKPFDPAELLARIHAILRRVPPSEIQIKRSVRFGKVTLRMPERTVERAGQPTLPLTSADFKLLSLFLTQPNQLLTREVISSNIGIKASSSSRIIDVRISRLRNRIGDHTASIIQTVRNEGYILPANIEYLNDNQ